MALLQNQMVGLMDSFLQPEPKDLVGLMEILGDILHHLGVQGAGAVSLKIAEHLLPLFEDVSGSGWAGRDLMGAEGGRVLSENHSREDRVGSSG